MKRYLHIHWTKAGPGEPGHTYSELDSARHETRKVELYPNGTRGFADGSEESGGTFLGSLPVPPLAELAGDPAFEAREIAVEEFQRQWLKRR
jgi:hypothetical protein